MLTHKYTKNHDVYYCKIVKLHVYKVEIATKDKKSGKVEKLVCIKSILL